MRVIALGGAGEMGRAAARVLHDDDRVTALTVADRDGAAAAEVAGGLGAKATARTLDATGGRALVAAFREADLVVNTVGPFFRFGPPVLAAAIEARIDYIDICDDPQPTLDMLALDARARAAGVTALLGMGASPGIANLLAVLAGAELERVETVVTGWNIHDAQPQRGGAQPSAAVVHGMEQISGVIPVTRAGLLVDHPALEPIPLDYPGLGTALGRSFGHPEPVTLPRAFPGLREATCVVIGDRATMAALMTLRWSIDRGLLSLDGAARVASLIERLQPADTLRQLTSAGLPPLFAIATGLRAGRRATAATALCQVPGLTMAENTGVPLAVAALLLPDLRVPGVHTPETLLDPGRFFAALAPHCLGTPGPGAMTVTTTSWNTPGQNDAALSSTLLTALLTVR
ncbi:saccharopine dehydrogenase family protein [Nocardia thailandica]|uniref:Saccharopine dehydrogenase family protein n=1 Tax=Nocardia thailandica TaxID=257275 RepID=A0ABW6PHJ2_9NOCA